MAKDITEEQVIADLQKHFVRFKEKQPGEYSRKDIALMFGISEKTARNQMAILVKNGEYTETNAYDPEIKKVVKVYRKI